jgi:hypothetical protein
MDAGEPTVLLSRYRLDQHLGTGGMGTIWRATDLLLKRDVAVKLMATQLRLDPVSWERFRREAQYQAALRHPGITEVYDYGEHDGQPFIVMEFLDGGDLHALLRASPGGLPAGQAVSLAIQAADALAYLHDSGILHRDIKSANLFLARDGQLKVCDFGVAKSLGSASITHAGARLGTWAYLAPEVWLGEDATASSDLYALGCVMHEMLTGQPPFSVLQDEMAVRQAHLRDEVPPPRGEHPVPERLSGLVSELLSKDPRARPSTARELAEDLRAVAAATEAAGSGDALVVALGHAPGGSGGAPAAATVPRTRELPPGYYQSAAPAPAGLAVGGPGLGNGGPAGTALASPVSASPVSPSPAVADRHALAAFGEPRGQDGARLWTWASLVSAWLVFATMVALCAAIAAGHLAPEYRLFVLVPAAIYTLPGAVAVSHATFSRAGQAALVFVSLWISEAAAILVASHVRPAEAWSAIMVFAWLGAISAAVHYSA